MLYKQKPNIAQLKTKTIMLLCAAQHTHTHIYSYRRSTAIHIVFAANRAHSYSHSVFFLHMNLRARIQSHRSFVASSMYCHCCCQSVHGRAFTITYLFVKTSRSRTSIRSFLKHRAVTAAVVVECVFDECCCYCRRFFVCVLCAVSHSRCFALFVKPHHDHDNFPFRLVFGISSTWCWTLLLHKCLKCIRCPLIRSTQPNAVFVAILCVRKYCFISFFLYFLLFSDSVRSCTKFVRFGNRRNAKTSEREWNRKLRTRAHCGRA